MEANCFFQIHSAIPPATRITPKVDPMPIPKPVPSASVLLDVLDTDGGAAAEDEEERGVVASSEVFKLELVVTEEMLPVVAILVIVPAPLVGVNVLPPIVDI